ATAAKATAKHSGVLYCFLRPRRGVLSPQQIQFEESPDPAAGLKSTDTGLEIVYPDKVCDALENMRQVETPKRMLDSEARLSGLDGKSARMVRWWSIWDEQTSQARI
ncbi:hypothetical protein MMC12_008508, partial [Toensbergia leucococca]|nr:hypothetical protein [Toensbergia leucococca]